MDEWKKDYTIMFNLRESVRSYYFRTHWQLPTPKLLNYLNSLEYDKLIKVRTLYRERWLKSYFGGAK
jgi:hypothetical protein